MNAPDRILTVLAAILAMASAGGAPSQLGETSDSVGMAGAVVVAVGAIARFLHEYRNRKVVSVQDVTAAVVGVVVLVLSMLGVLSRLAPDVDLFATGSAIVVGIGAAVRSFAKDSSHA